MTERTYAGYTLAQLRALGDAADRNVTTMVFVRDGGERVFSPSHDQLFDAIRTAMPALCEYIKDLEGEYAALEYLDSEATIGAELVNEELRQLRARVATLEARRGDLAGLLAGILECLDHDDTWTKAVRQTTAATIRAALEARDD